MKQKSGVRSGNHSGRKSKNGHVYSTKHNDRKFDLQKAEHINPEQTDRNRYWTFTEISNTGKVKFKKQEHKMNEISFDDFEQEIYSELFSKQLSMINENYIKQRHKEKVQSMYDFRTKNDKHCVEEDIITFGTRKKHIDTETFVKIFERYTTWHQQTFGDAVILLNAAMHIDEPQAAPHIHLRKVWAADYVQYAERCNAEADWHNQIAEHHNEEIEKSGHGKKMKMKALKEIPEQDFKIVNQTEALLQMGIDRPEPDKPESRRNNAKMTYTHMCREKLIEIAKEFGVEIIEEPKERSENGLSLLAYKTRELEAELQHLNTELEKRKLALQSADEDIAVLKKQQEDFQEQNQNLQTEITSKEDEILKLIHSVQYLNNLQEPTPPKKGLVESEEKFKKRKEKYEQERNQYLQQIANIPPLKSIKKKLDELEKRKQMMDEEVEQRVKKIYGEEFLLFCRELKRIPLPDSETNILDYYKSFVEESNLMSIQNRLFEEVKRQEQQQAEQQIKSEHHQRQAEYDDF